MPAQTDYPDLPATEPLPADPVSVLLAHVAQLREKTGRGKTPGDADWRTLERLVRDVVREEKPDVAHLRGDGAKAMLAKCLAVVADVPVVEAEYLYGRAMRATLDKVRAGLMQLERGVV